MIERKVKERYFKLIDSLGLEAHVADHMKVFIDTYNGTNLKELNHMLLDVFKILIDLPDLKIKAEGFDKLKKTEEVFDKKLAEIKKQFEAIDRGYIFEMPALS